MTDDVNVQFGATTADLDSGIAHVKDKLAEIGVVGYFDCGGKRSMASDRPQCY
jgi:hypothetical protein